MGSWERPSFSPAAMWARRSKAEGMRVDDHTELVRQTMCGAVPAALDSGHYHRRPLVLSRSEGPGWLPARVLSGDRGCQSKGHRAKEIGNEADKVGNEADNVGHEADDVGNEADDVGNEANDVGNEANDVGNEAAEVGN